MRIFCVVNHVINELLLVPSLSYREPTSLQHPVQCRSLALEMFSLA